MDWLATYKASHQNRYNRLCHNFGIPLIVVSLGALFFSWRWALALFVVGWALQFIGHAFEGKPPAFFKSPRYLLIGPWWWVTSLVASRKRHHSKAPLSDEDEINS